MKDIEYAELFRDAYALLHGGRPGELELTQRNATESTEEFLARTRADAIGATRKQLAAAEPPPELADPHRLLVHLLDNAAQAEEALQHQVRAYQCGQFHESVVQSDRLHELVVESQRADRELIEALRRLPTKARMELGIEI